MMRKEREKFISIRVGFIGKVLIIKRGCLYVCYEFS